MHQGLINFFTEMTNGRITSANFVKKFIGANCFMENLEIKCSQLCFDTTNKIIFMNDTPINIIIHIQSITPKLFCITWTVLKGALTTSASSPFFSKKVEIFISLEGYTYVVTAC